MRLVVQKHVTIGLLILEKKRDGLLALLANLPHLPLACETPLHLHSIVSSNAAIVLTSKLME